MSEAEFSKLIETLLPRIMSRCWRVAGSGGAEDLAQEVFLRAWGRRHQLRMPNKAAQWITAIARNVCRDFCRRQLRQDILVQNLDHVVPPIDPSTLSTNKDNVLALTEAIDQLSPKEREVVTRRLRGYTFHEIARDLGVPATTVRRLWAKACASLRKVLV